jgi:4-methylaminobutanoate oxidase (formaldehyde-forming)
MGYVRHPEAGLPGFVEAGKYEVEIAGERFRAQPSLRPPYDPEGARVRM